VQGPKNREVKRRSTSSELERGGNSPQRSQSTSLLYRRESNAVVVLEALDSEGSDGQVLLSLPPLPRVGQSLECDLSPNYPWILFEA